MVLTIRDLCGATRFVPADEVPTVGALRQWAADRHGLPSPSLLRLKCGCRDLVCDAAPLDLEQANGVHVLLRLPGGKGGFGAMLRTAGMKGVKTTNFDACRDLNGRRLRYVNQEAKLREWEAQAEERKAKKQAEKDANRKPEKNVPRFDDDEYDEMLQTTRDSVAQAVAAAGAAAAASSSAGGASSSTADATDGPAASSSSSGSKRTAEAEAPSATAPKVAKMWADPLAGLEGSSSEEDEEGAEGAEETEAAAPAPSKGKGKAKA